MKESQALTMLAPEITGSDAVYSVMRRKKRSFLASLMDVIVTQDLFGSSKDFADNMSSPYFVVVSDDAARVISVKDGSISDVIRVPDWKGSKTSFRSVTVDGYNYSKVARIQ